MDDDDVAAVRKAMAGESPEIVVFRDGKRVDASKLAGMVGKDLLDCDVTVSGYAVCFFEASVLDERSFRRDEGDEESRGVGYHYRNVGSGASEGSLESSAMNMVNSAYGISKCWDKNDCLVI